MLSPPSFLLSYSSTFRPSFGSNSIQLLSSLQNGATKVTPAFVVLSLLSTLTAAVVLPEQALGPLIERDDASTGNSTIDPDCAQGCGIPPNYERWGARPLFPSCLAVERGPLLNQMYIHWLTMSTSQTCTKSTQICIRQRYKCASDSQVCVISNIFITITQMP